MTSPFLSFEIEIGGIGENGGKCEFALADRP